MEKYVLAPDQGTTIKQLRVDGGATINDLLLQIQEQWAACRIFQPSQNNNSSLLIAEKEEGCKCL